MTDLQDKFNALDASLSGQLAAIASGQAANVTGLQAIAAALQAIGSCLCEEIASDPTGEPTPVVLPPPPDLCGAYERAERVQSWQLQGEQTIGGVACKLWAPLMTYTAGVQGWRPHTATEAGKRAHIANLNAYAIFWCFTWDFTGMVAPVAIYEDWRSSNYDAMTTSTTGFAFPGNTDIRGSRANDKPAAWAGPGNPVSNQYVQYIVAYPATYPSPPYNAWFRYPGAG